MKREPKPERVLPDTVKPGDIVYRVAPNALDYSPNNWIQAGVYIGPKRDSNIRARRARVHYGWIGAEETWESQLFVTLDEARAHVRVELKKYLAKMRKRLKGLTALDVATVTPQDRTKQIKPRKLEELLSTERAIRDLSE